MADWISPQDIENGAEDYLRCDIKSSLSSVYLVALGTSGVSPLEMASAFATFATGGIRHKPFWIRRVEDALGRILEERIVSGKRSLDASVAYQVVDMMQGVLNDGTGAYIRKNLQSSKIMDFVN